MRLLSIDPGKRSLAWALWVSGVLTACGLVRHTRKDWARELRQMVLQVDCLAGGHYDAVAVELPRIYPKDRDRRPNDIIDLAAAAGACAGLGPLEFVHPRQWKGQLPKRISVARTLDALSGGELMVLRDSGKGSDHNVLDAIGLGLWRLEAHHARG